MTSETKRTPARKTPARKAPTSLARKTATRPLRAAEPPPPTAAAGWYPSPANPAVRAFWDGARWVDDAAPPADTPTTQTILFRGRHLDVQSLTAEQVGVWQLTLDRLVRVDEKLRAGQPGVAEEEYGPLLARGIRTITSVLARDADKHWIEDALLEREFTLMEAADIVGLSADAFATAAPNREQRRATSRARRRT